ncbi:MAG: transposase [Planctomycetes bacterium]|nr:transposase [Planctomycetota bacterium]
MRVGVSKRLIAWETLEDSPSLKTIRDFLGALPDGRLLAALRLYRGRGRDDHPVHVLWGVVVLTVLLRHVSFAATLGELRRNEGLRLLIGIEREEDVPDDWNVSRFLRVLGLPEHLGLLREMFDTMARGLGQAVPELGRHVAGDATGLCARLGRAKEGKVPAGVLPEPSGGRKEYKDEEGKVVRVVEWFGYKLHLLVDVAAEVALAYRVTAPSVGDNEVLPELVKEALANLAPGEVPAASGPKAPEPAPRAPKAPRGPIFRRIKSLAYDMAADDEKVHELLAEHGIKPLIQNRSMWTEELERMLPGHDGRSNIVYDEAGTIYCYDKVSDPPVRHKMAYIGHEPARGTVKWRCPAMHGGWSCPSLQRCNAGKKYGKTVRVKCELDLRRFPPIPRATKLFERLYKGRSAVERVNGRLKVFWGADDGNVTGAERFHAHVGVVMVVHIGLATLLAKASRREGTLGTMRLTAVAEALHGKPPAACDG